MTSKRTRKVDREDRGIVTETLVWGGVTIEVAYEADWLNSSEGPLPVSHLAISSTAPAKAPLPFTETGYRSHFLEPGTVEAAGGPAAYVMAWLDDAARDPKWRRGEQARRQLDLFG